MALPPPRAFLLAERTRGVAAAARSEAEKGWGAGIQDRNANASRCSSAWLRSARCKSEKGPVRARMSARDENKETQPAAPPLPPLSIPGRVFCWPGQIRWFLGPTPAPGQKPRSPGRALGLAALHRPSCATQHRRGNPAAGAVPAVIWQRWWWGGGGSAWGISGQGGEVATGIFGAPGRDGRDCTGGQTTPARSGCVDGDTLRRRSRAKVRAKRSFWDGRFAFKGGQQRNIKRGG